MYSSVSEGLGLRYVVGLLLVIGMVVGCSSDADTITSIGPTTMITTTTSTSTTSTTTTIPEIQVEPLPEMPTASLTDAYGGPLPIETACLNLDIAPTVMDSAQLEMALIETFRFMGIEVVEDDCDLEVDVAFQGGRYSAEYMGLGECFTGYTIEGAASVTAFGEGLASPVDVDHEPPLSISTCSGYAKPPGGFVPLFKIYAAVGEPLEALLGPIARIAIPFGSDYLNFFEFVGDPSDLTVVDLLASALYMDDPLDRCRVVEVAHNWDWVGGEAEEPDLMPLVPHLLATYLELVEIDHDTYLSRDSGLWNCDGEIEDALRRITRQEDLRGPAEWVAWWLEHQGD